MSVPRDDWPIIEGYKTIEHIGTGGYSLIFKATQESFERPVKVKVFWPSPSVGDKEMALQRFEQEAKIIGKLEHDCIERYINQGITFDKRNYLITEYFEGVSIKERLQNVGTFDIEQAVNIIITVCKCIKYCHEKGAKGVIHRDIKPSNILINTEGKIKVIDFGIAYDFEEKVRTFSTSTTVGTIGYISPERQQDPKHRDKRDDIYAIGVTLYEMLVGHRPSPIFKLISDVIDDVDPLIDEIIHTSLSPEESRYATIDELLMALTSFEFLKIEKKKQREEMKKKSSTWAQSMADKKQSIIKEMESVRKRMEVQVREDEKLWLKSINEHISDLTQIVDDLNNTGTFKLIYNWKNVDKRPTIHRGSEGPIIGEILLSTYESMRIHLGCLEPAYFVGEFIQPGIIWETNHSKRSTKVMQEAIFVVDTKGHIQIHSSNMGHKQMQFGKIQEVYQEFLERKLLWSRGEDEQVIDNIILALSSSHFQYRRDQGYDLVEKMIPGDIPLHHKIAEKLFDLLFNLSMSEGERSRCINLLRKAGYIRIAQRILNYWINNQNQISDKLSGQLANYFTISIDCLDILLEALSTSEPLGDNILPHIFIAIRVHVTTRTDIGKDRLNKIVEIVEKYKANKNLIDILNDVHKVITGKDIQ